MRVSMQTVVLAVLVGVAIAYFTLPSRAASSCTSWVTQMQEDEGGAVLTTSACSDDATETLLQLRCFDRRLLVELDLAAGADRTPETAETGEIEFVTDGGSVRVPVRFEEMTAYFAGEVPLEAPLLGLLQTQKGLLVRDSAARYPARTYSLKGSRAALDALVAECR